MGRSYSEASMYRVLTLLAAILRPLGLCLRRKRETIPGPVVGGFQTYTGGKRSWSIGRA